MRRRRLAPVERGIAGGRPAVSWQARCYDGLQPPKEYPMSPMFANLHRRRLAWLAPLLALLIAACGGGGSSSESSGPPASSERELSPVAIDPRVDTATEPHVAINPAPTAVAADRLFVFLPGTEGTPSLYRYVLRVGAARGYHAIGLSYPNALAVGVLCSNSGDAECFWDVRREVITGSNLSARIDVNEANSIDTRLAMALGYLARTFPEEGWGRFVEGGVPVWSRIVVAGHSQGGGHAGVIAKLRPVQRAVYFAAPADWDTATDAPASWMARAGQTAAERQYGFGHLRDPLVPNDQVLRAWTALGMAGFGAATRVDGVSSPYGGSRMLTTDAPPALGISASPFHGAPVLDTVTPLADDRTTPLYAPVWIYLAFP